MHMWVVYKAILRGHAKAVDGVTVLVPSHSFQVTTIHLKIGDQQTKFTRYILSTNPWWGSVINDAHRLCEMELFSDNKSGIYWECHNGRHITSPGFSSLVWCRCSCLKDPGCRGYSPCKCGLYIIRWQDMVACDIAWAIIWANADQIHWRIHAALGRDGWDKLLIVISDRTHRITRSLTQQLAGKWVLSHVPTPAIKPCQETHNCCIMHCLTYGLTTYSLDTW